VHIGQAFAAAGVYAFMHASDRSSDPEAVIGAMFTAARCAWLGFVEAHRFDAVLIALGGFLVLVLFSLFHERIGRLPRRIFQLAIAMFIVVGVGAVVYEIQSPPECTASSDEANVDVPSDN
jgi:hypothetical protein